MKMRGIPKNGIITGISISPAGVICISPIISTIIEMRQNYLIIPVSETIEKIAERIHTNLKSVLRFIFSPDSTR